MKLLFLGTGAADWIPEWHERVGYVRRYSSALINDDLLIDPGPDIWDYREKLGTPDMFKNIKSIIVTHSHDDHFKVSSIRRLCKEADHPIKVFMEKNSFGKFAKEDEIPGVILCPLTPTVPFETEGYNIIPCRSNHSKFLEGEQSLNYIVREKSSGRAFFYGSDSGWIVYDTWQLIKQERPNVVIFECTVGPNQEGDDRIFGHTSVPMIGIMMQTMTKQHGPADDARYYTTHMAMTLHKNHEDTARALAPFGVTPAYDGLEIEI